MKLSFRNSLMMLSTLTTLTFCHACFTQETIRPISTESDSAIVETPTATNFFTPGPFPSLTPQTPANRGASTPTPFPFITPENARPVMIDLMKGNGGCELPCLFGLTPGVSSQTSIDAWINFFQGQRIDNKNIEMGGLGTVIFYNEQTRLYVHYSSTYLSLPPGSGLENMVFSTESSNLQLTETVYDDVADIKIMEYYSLANILQTYGAPSEIWVLPFPTDPIRPDETYPFSVLLFYPRNHFIVEYVSARQEDSKDYFGCQPTTRINLATWDPDRQKSLVEALVFLGGVANELNIGLFRTLLDATGLTIDEFYKMFSDQGKPECLHTPKSIWPFSETIIIP